MQASDPGLPSREYVPDGEPHVFGDRVYGSYDYFHVPVFCVGDGLSCEPHLIFSLLFPRTVNETTVSPSATSFPRPQPLLPVTVGTPDAAEELKSPPSPLGKEGRVSGRRGPRSCGRGDKFCE